MLLRQLLKIAAVLICSRRSKASFSSFTRICSAAAIFAIIVFSRRKDWPSLYHSLGRQTYTLRHYRTDVPPDLMNREISSIFSGRISDVRDGGPVLSDKGRDTMNIMKNAEFPDDWLLGLRQVVRDPVLYELLKYCPLEIMQYRAFMRCRLSMFC